MTVTLFRLGCRHCSSGGPRNTGFVEFPFQLRQILVEQWRELLPELLKRFAAQFVRLPMGLCRSVTATKCTAIRMADSLHDRRQYDLGSFGVLYLR